MTHLFIDTKEMDNRRKKSYLIDMLVVLLNISTGGNLLLYILLSIQKATWVYGITILIDLFYVFSKLSDKTNYTRYIKTPGVIIFNVLLAYNLVNVMIRGNGDFVTHLNYFVLSVLLTLILSCLSAKLDLQQLQISNRIYHLSAGYIWLSMMSVFGVVITFILFLCGFSHFSQFFADILVNNLESGSTYVWSFLSANLLSASVRVPFFQDFGILCGLYHEPHILAYNIFPCIFLLIGLAKKQIHRIMWIAIAILFVFFCGSTTNILALSGCLIVWVLFSFRHHFFLVVLTLSTVVGFFLWYITYDDTFWLIVMGRLLDDSNMSNEASRNLLSFAFTPKTLFGTNFFSSSMMWEQKINEDVGLIPFMMNILFLFFYIRNIFNLLNINDRYAKTVGYASLYYLLHSAKMGMIMYKSCLPLLFVFLQTIIIDYYGRVCTSRKNLQ